MERVRSAHARPIPPLADGARIGLSGSNRLKAALIGLFVLVGGYLLLLTFAKASHLSFEPSPKTLAVGDIDSILFDVESFAAQNQGRYPPTLAALRVWAGSRGETLPRTDPWGADYVYRVAPDRGSFQVISPGHDGVLDTKDDLSLPRARPGPNR